MRIQASRVFAVTVALLATQVHAQFNFGPRETHLDVGSPGEWNDLDVLNPVVLETEVFAGSPYTMYYTGHGGPEGHPLEEYVVGVAHSSDGENWTRSVTACLGWGPPGSWDSGGMIWHTVIEDPSMSPARFRMYYAASGLADHKLRIGLAFSADGKTFSKFPGNPILDVGLPGAWDAGGVFGCSVLQPFESGAPVWRMWYTGLSHRVPGPGVTAGIGHATSPDGLFWFKDPIPLPAWSVGAVDLAYFYQPVVRFIEGAYHLWISKLHDRVGLAYTSIHWATSPDGMFTWEGPFHSDGLMRGVSQPSPLWDSVGNEVRLWLVKKDGGGTHPFYGGLYDNIAMTRSPIFRDHPGEPYLISNGIYILGLPLTITTIDTRAAGAPYALLLDGAFNSTPASIPLPFGVLALNSPMAFLSGTLDPGGYHSILLPGFTDPLAIGVRVNFQSVVVEFPMTSDAFTNPMTVHLVRSP